MLAEIIAIGDELTSGQRLDTNTQWLSERLGEIGIAVAFHTTVGDDLDNNVAVFRAAIERADVVIATGGLGPTADDLTRDAIAAAAGVGLVEDAGALEHIRSLFARRKREMPERNLLQAQLPRGGRVVPNLEGTAPGIDLEVPREGRSACRVFALPGVPAEMFVMWRDTVRPALVAMQPAPRVIMHHRIKCFGVGESDLEAMLPDMIRRKREPLVGITVHNATITLRITTSGSNEAECLAAMGPTIEEIHQQLGVLVFGEEEDELEYAVVRLLEHQGHTLGVVEWGTDGLVSHWLAEAVGLSSCFCGGQVFPISAIEAKTPNFEPAAKAARQTFAASIGLAVALMPADNGSSTLHIAVALGDNVRVKVVTASTHPAILKARSAKLALNLVRLALLNREA